MAGTGKSAYIEVNPQKYYGLAVTAKADAGVTVTAGVECFDSGKTSLGIRPFVLNAVGVTTSWVRYSDLIQGEGTGANQFYSGTRFVKVYLALNAGTGSAWFDDVVFQEAANADFLEDGVISTLKVADGAITTTKITDSAVTTLKIGDGAITTSKIVDGNVTTLKIADGAITGGKIQDSTITNAKIVDSTITGAKLADVTITGAKIADATITNAKISDLSISKLTAGNLTVTQTVAVGGSILVGTAGGARVEITDSHVAGYNSLNVLQFELDKTSGQGSCGGGAVTLGEDGIQIDNNYGQSMIRFFYTGATYSETIIRHASTHQGRFQTTYNGGGVNHTVAMECHPYHLSAPNFIISIADDDALTTTDHYFGINYQKIYPDGTTFDIKIPKASTTAYLDFENDLSGGKIHVRVQDYLTVGKVTNTGTDPLLVYDKANSRNLFKVGTSDNRTYMSFIPDHAWNTYINLGSSGERFWDIHGTYYYIYGAIFPKDAGATKLGISFAGADPYVRLEGGSGTRKYLVADGRTRSVPPDTLSPENGYTSGSGNVFWRTWGDIQFDKGGTTKYCNLIFRVPEDWDSGSVYLKAIAIGGTATGSYTWTIYYSYYIHNVGTPGTQRVNTTGTTSNTVYGYNDGVTHITLITIPSTDLAAGRRIYIRVRNNTAPSYNTMVSNFYLEYTAEH